VNGKNQHFRRADQGGALWQGDIPRVDLSTRGETPHRNTDELRNMCCLSFHTNRVVLKLDHHAGVRLAIDVNTDIHGDLLALAHNNQVQVLDNLAYWVALDVFDQH